MAKIVGTDKVKDALLTNTNDVIESVDDAEASYADLDTRLDGIDNAVAALAAGSGVVVSSNDTTVGFLNGKLVAGEGIDFTENNDGGDETLTISGEIATATNKGVASFDPGQFDISAGAISGRSMEFQTFALSIM